MPGRLLPLVTHEYYHIFNRGIDKRPTFTTKSEYFRAFSALQYYHYSSLPLSFSKVLQLEKSRREELLIKLKGNPKLVSVLCFSLMPNHFHLLVRQQKDNGISKYLSNFLNSYTRFYNTRHERDGSLFLDQFKAIRIESDDQLLHVSRYIHLNSHTGFVVKTLAEAETYPWSSYPLYLNPKSNTWVETKEILSHFKNLRAYHEFVSDRSDYQRKLKAIEHLLLE